MAKYNPIVKFTYSRRLKAKGIKPGRINYFKFRGKRVKAYVTPDGKSLQVLNAPKSVLPEIVKAEKLVPREGILQAYGPKKKPEKAQPEAEAPKPKPEKPKSTPPPKPEQKPPQKPKYIRPRELTK